MFRKIAVLAIPYFVLPSISFLVISFLVFIKKASPKLIKQKLVIGAMIIPLTVFLNIFSVSYGSDHDRPASNELEYELADYGTLFKRGLSYVKREKYDNALEQFRRAAKKDPGRIEVHNNIGAALLFNGNTKDALEEFMICYILNPKDAEVHINLAITHFLLEDHESAKNEFEKAVAINKELKKDQVLKMLNENKKISSDILLSKVLWKVINEYY